MSQSVTGKIPNQAEVDRKLAQSRYQISTLRQTAEPASRSAVAAESCASAAIDQMLEALSATLHGINLLMPDPLPALRVSRRNLRDRFYAVQCESRALHEVEAAARPGAGWLWWLEEKAAGSTFAPLLREAEGDSPALWKDPLQPELGVESTSPVEYLDQSLAGIEQLIRSVVGLAEDDMARYRDALSRQTRRLM